MPFANGESLPFLPTNKQMEDGLGWQHEGLMRVCYLDAKKCENGKEWITNTKEVQWN